VGSPGKAVLLATSVPVVADPSPAVRSPPGRRPREADRACLPRENAYVPTNGSVKRGRPGFDGDSEAKVAGRGAAGLVKSGTALIANDYDYALAA